MLLGAITGAIGIGSLTSALSGLANEYFAGKSRKFAKKQQGRAHEFAERMYRHRYEYTMEDMRRAGLNPILAYVQGAGSTPSGVAPAASGAPAPVNFGQNLTGAMDTVARGTKLDPETRLIDEQGRTTAAQREGIAAGVAKDTTQAAVNDRLVDKVRQETATSAAAEVEHKMGAMQKMEQANTFSAQAEATRLENQIRKRDKEIYDTEEGKYLRRTERWLGAIGKAFGGNVGVTSIHK